MNDKDPRSSSSAPDGAKVSRRRLLGLLAGGIVGMALPKPAAAQQRPEESRGDFPFPMSPQEMPTGKILAEKLKTQEERLAQLKQFVSQYGFYAAPETTPTREQEVILDDIYGTIRAAAHNHHFSENTIAVRRIHDAQSAWKNFITLYPQMPKQLGEHIDQLVTRFEAQQPHKVR